MNTDSLTLGIDVAKKNFTACLLDGEGRVRTMSGQYVMSREGFDHLLGELGRHLESADRLTVGIEASGALDDNLLAWFTTIKTQWSVQTMRINPAMISCFSSPRPLRAKTDGGDARRTAQFTQFYAEQLDCFEHDPQAQAMGRLVNERAELVEQRTALINRLKDRLVIAWPEFTQVFIQPTGALGLAVLERVPTAALAARKRPATLASISSGPRGRKLGRARAQQLITLAKNSIASACSDSDAAAIRFMINQLRLLRGRIEQIERELIDYKASAAAEPVPTDPAAPLSIPAQIARIGAMRGIGTVGAATVVLRARGLTRFTSAKALAAQMGACPQRFQTGQSADRGRLCRSGDRRTRSTLYLLAWMMTIFDPAMAFHCWRMQKKGLKPKQAISACINRLARLMWAVVNTDRARAIANARHHHPELWKEFVQLSKTNGKLWKNLEHLCVDTA